MPPTPPSTLLSVVMPVHNALPHLDDAVRSILDQTVRDFEFVIFDDASTDGSTARLREWASKDPRIRLFEGTHQLGMVGSSAKVVEHSRTPLLARMDADDVSAPDRLAQQLALLDSRPQAGLVGTLFDIIDAQGRRLRGPDYWKLARRSPFVPFAAHGSIMFRREIFERAGGYRAECEYWEDQDLVTRIAALAEVWVIPSPLYSVRQWNRSSSVAPDSERVEQAIDLAYRCVARPAAQPDYDALLAASASDPGRRVDPRVFISVGSKELWTGGRPQLFGRLLRRGKLGFDRATATAVAWTLLAAASPGTLRGMIKGLLWVRNRKAANFKGSGPMTWVPNRPCVAQPAEPITTARSQPPSRARTPRGQDEPQHG